MSFSRPRQRFLRVLFHLSLLSFAPGAALAQSGTPAPMPPLKNPDPRVSPMLEAIGKGRSPGGLALSPVPDNSSIA